MGKEVPSGAEPCRDSLKGSITTPTRFDVPRRPSEDDGVALSFLYLWRVAPSSWSASTG